MRREYSYSQLKPKSVSPFFVPFLAKISNFRQNKMEQKNLRLLVEDFIKK